VLGFAVAAPPLGSHLSPPEKISPKGGLDGGRQWCVLQVSP